jgi:transcriptional regulator with XRE-family HTH domain
MSNQANDFIEWLDGQEKAKKLTDYEISKKGGFSHSVLSRARSGIAPQWDVCVKIASVLEVSPITVFRKAGLLPPGSDDDVNIEDWKHLLSQLTPEDQEELRQIAEMKLNKRQKESALKTLKPKKA